MKECCATCKRRMNIKKYDFTNGFRFEKPEGYICLAFVDEGEAVWVVGNNENEDICECYQPKDGET